MLASGMAINYWTFNAIGILLVFPFLATKTRHCIWLGNGNRVEHPTTTGMRIFRPVVNNSSVGSSVANTNIAGVKQIGGPKCLILVETLFCLGYRLSKHKMTMCSKNLGARPLWPPGYAYGCRSWGCNRTPKSFDLANIWAKSQKILANKIPHFLTILMKLYFLVIECINKSLCGRKHSKYVYNQQTVSSNFVI